MIKLCSPCTGKSALQYIQECLEAGWISYAGKFVDSLETMVANYVGVKYAIATNTGTAALHVALLLAGVKPGTKVFVPTLTFVATIAAIRYCGGIPVFIGCDADYNMEPKALLKAVKQTEITDGAVILPVHIFGTPCQPQVFEIAKQHNIPVVEDACQALGSWYAPSGVVPTIHAGTLGLLGCLSFSFNKMITTAAGGIILTNDPWLAHRARYLTTTAKDDVLEYIHNEVGYNYRMTNIHAAIGVSQMEELANVLRIKAANWQLYNNEIKKDPIPGVYLYSPPRDLQVSNFWFYALQIDKQEYGVSARKLIDILADKGIQTRPVWFPNHLQAPYRSFSYFDTRHTMRLWENTINLPCGVDLTESNISTIVGAIRDTARKS